MCGERGRRLRIACFVAAPAPSRNSLPLLSESDCFVGRMARQVPMSAADRTGGRGQGPSYTREPAQGVAVGSTASCRKLVGAEASHMSPMRTFHEEEAKAVGGGAPVQAERHVLRDKLLHWVGHDAAALWSVCSPEGKRVDPADLPRRMTNAGLSLGPREVEQLHRLMPPSSADGMIGWDEWVVVFGEGSGARCGGGVAMATATPAHAAAGMSTHQLGVPHTFPHRGENANEPPPMHPPTLAGAASSLPPYPQVTSESPFKPAPPVSEEWSYSTTRAFYRAQAMGVTYRRNITHLTHGAANRKEAAATSAAIIDAAGLNPNQTPRMRFRPIDMMTLFPLVIPRPVRAAAPPRPTPAGELCYHATAFPMRQVLPELRRLVTLSERSAYFDDAFVSMGWPCHGDLIGKTALLQFPDLINVTHCPSSARATDELGGAPFTCRTLAAHVDHVRHPITNAPGNRHSYLSPSFATARARNISATYKQFAAGDVPALPWQLFQYSDISLEERVAASREKMRPDTPGRMCGARTVS